MLSHCSKCDLAREKLEQNWPKIGTCKPGLRDGKDEDGRFYAVGGSTLPHRAHMYRFYANFARVFPRARPHFEQWESII